jgi:hypothetical protein
MTTFAPDLRTDRDDATWDDCVDAGLGANLSRPDELAELFSRYADEVPAHRER